MKVTRIYTGKDGEAHFQDLEVPFDSDQPGAYSPSYPVERLFFRRSTTDEDLARVISNGTAAGMPPFKLQPAELTGIIAYLRSLEPKAQGPVDFPGPHGSHKDKGGSSPSKSPSSSSSSSTTK